MRNSFVELLRVLFMMGIVIIHIYGWGSNLDYDWLYSLGGQINTAYHLSLYSLGKLGVTGFIFISGFYGIRMTKKKWLNLILMCITYYITLCLINSDYKSLVHSVHAWDTWWFLSSYFIICLLAPLIDNAFDSIEKKKIRLLVFGLLFYTYVGHFMMMNNDHDAVLLLSVYIFARYIKTYPPSLFTKYNWILCLVSLTIITLCPLLIEQLGGASFHKLQGMFLNNNNPIILATVATLVTYADKHSFNSRIINYIAASVIAVYLITEWPSIRANFNTVALPYVLKGYGLLIVPIVTIICVMIESLRKTIFKKPVDYLSKKYFNE